MEVQWRVEGGAVRECSERVKASRVSIRAEARREDSSGLEGRRAAAPRSSLRPISLSETTCPVSETQCSRLVRWWTTAARHTLTHSHTHTLTHSHTHTLTHSHTHTLTHSHTHTYVTQFIPSVQYSRNSFVISMLQGSLLFLRAVPPPPPPPWLTLLCAARRLEVVLWRFF